MYISPGIYIDEFFNTSIEDDKVLFLLTHWHADHIKGLNNNFQGTVWCSEITACMLQQIYPNVKVKKIKLNRYINGLAIKILPLDANHLPGSLMFYIPHSDILYTGDYRLNKQMLKYVKRRIKQVDTIFVDGTFHHPNIKLLSEDKSVRLFRNFITDTTGPIAVGIYHAGICALLTKLNLRFAIHSSVPTKLRRSLHCMFGDNIAKRSRFMIVNPATFKGRSHTLIIPSSLWFNCRGNSAFVDRVVWDPDKHGWRLNFTCHSDYADNITLFDALKVTKPVLLNDNRANLECL